MTIRIGLAVILLAALSASSCKKDKDDTNPEPAVNCDLLVSTKDSLGPGTPGVTTLEYDDQGRVVKQTSHTGQVNTTEYLDNGTTIKETSPDLIRTYTLNSAGRVTKVSTLYGSGSVDVDELTLTGDYVTERLQKRYAFEGSVPSVDTIIYSNTISGGNLVKIIAQDQLGVNIFVVDFSFDLSRPFTSSNIPDPYALYSTAIITGPSKNMYHRAYITSTSGFQEFNIDYEYDSKGRIVKTSSSYNGTNFPAPSVETSWFTYRCD